MPRDPIWRPDPELNAEAEELRKQHRDGGQSMSLGDFYAFMPMHNYLYVPTRTPWPAASVNSRLPPIALTGADGQPVLGPNGQPKKIAAPLGSTRTGPSSR